jgi:predicted alpha-1,2-mannosidase
MKFNFTIMVLFSVVVSVNTVIGRELSLTQYVNPLIGTAPNPLVHTGLGSDPGSVFPGAVCPRGMVAWSPDTPHSFKVAGGYWYPDSEIDDFSLTHFSGRGVVCLKDFPFMPVVSNIDSSPGIHWERFEASFSHRNETASPGFYQVKFDNGIKTELTATPRTGMARFTYPVGSLVSLLIRTDGFVSVGKNEVEGYHDAKIGGGRRSYAIYFIARFDRSFQSARTWHGGVMSNKTTQKNDTCGAVLMFGDSKDTIVRVKVGISYVSIENARENLQSENPGWNFNAIQQLAKTMWNEKLKCIQVSGGSEEEMQVFYTALYHCFIHPNLLDDISRQYPGMDGKIHTVKAGHHQYQNIPAWDEHRSLSPLIAMLTPNESSDINQSLVNFAQQDESVRKNGGGFPRWEQVNRNSGGMVGDGDDQFISSSYAFGARKFDTHAALAIMDRSASVPGITSDGFEVRDGLMDYMDIGYVPEKVSVTLEYCNDDFALAQFAKALGQKRMYIKFRNRSQNWKNLFDGSTKYLRPKNSEGRWEENFSPVTKQGFTEGTAAQYVWMVNFDLRSLIDSMGGDRMAIERLDRFFSKLNSGGKAETAWMGNEPCEGDPWTYDFAGAPWRTQDVVHRIQNELFTGRPDGLPGNDDAGALSSWFVFSAIGLYPEIPGVAGFVVCSPMFGKAIIHVGNGSTLNIIAGDKLPYGYYIRDARLNSKEYESCWIPWSSISNGGTIKFEISDKPSRWGSRQSQSPPSFDFVGQ